MQKRKLGSTGLEVSAIGLGCMGMSFGYGPAADKQEMISLLRSAVERGVTFFDTAEVYGPFTNEELVGEALAPFRGQVVIATKFGFKPDPEGGPRWVGLDSRPEHIKEVAEASLKRLRVGAIDLFYQHRVDPSCADRGRGWSGEGPDRGRQGEALRPVRSRRADDPPCARRSAGDCGAERILAVVASPGSGGAADAGGTRDRLRSYSPLGKGFLTGKIDANTEFDSTDFRNIIPRFTPEARKINQALVDLLGRIGGRKKATPAQIALAWLLAQKPWIVPIPGTTKLHRLEENIGAAAVELTPDDLREIGGAAAKIVVEGARYPENLERMTGR